MTIINRELGFVFLKSRKTASSSVEIHLITNTLLGQDIYATSREILDLRWPRARNQRALIPGSSRWWYTPGTREHQCRSRIRGFDRIFPILSQHDPAKKVRFMTGPGFFDKAVKAVPVRNPWDALVSFYEWERSGGQGRKKPLELTWSDWFDRRVGVRQAEGPSLAEQFLFYDHLHVGSRPIDVEFIYFEDISASLDQLSKRLGLPAGKLGALNIHLKAGQRKRDYREYFSDPQAEFVSKAFYSYIEKTGYRYDSPG